VCVAGGPNAVGAEAAAASIDPSALRPSSSSLAPIGVPDSLGRLLRARLDPVLRRGWR
jgi:hypothetical protein